MVLDAAIPDFSRFVSPLESPLTGIGADTSSIHSLHDRLYRSSNNHPQTRQKERRQTRLLQSFHSLRVPLGTRLDRFQSVTSTTGFALLRGVGRSMVGTASCHIPSFVVAAIAAATGRGAVKVNFVAFMVRVTETRVADDAGWIRLTRATIPSNVPTLENIATRTSRASV